MEFLNTYILYDSSCLLDCVKGFTNLRKRNTNHSLQRLQKENIHSDFCGSFPTPSFNGHHYFITFIDELSPSRLHPFILRNSIVLGFQSFQNRGQKST